MVEGLDALRRRFEQVVPEAVRKAAIDAMEKGAQEVVDMARSLVSVESGALRDSIGWTWGDAPNGSLTLGTVSGHEYGALRITIYAGNDDAFYAAWIEFGTQPHGLGVAADVSRGTRQALGAVHPGSAAHPFFFPAYRSLRKRIRSRITRNINRAIRKGMK